MWLITLTQKKRTIILCSRPRLRTRTKKRLKLTTRRITSIQTTRSWARDITTYKAIGSRNSRKAQLQLCSKHRLHLKTFRKKFYNKKPRPTTATSKTPLQCPFIRDAPNFWSQTKQPRTIKILHLRSRSSKWQQTVPTLWKWFQLTTN